MKIEKISSQNIDSLGIKKFILCLSFSIFLEGCKIIDKKYKCESNVPLEKCLINYVVQNNLLKSVNAKYNSDKSIYLHKINIGGCTVYLVLRKRSGSGSILYTEAAL